MTYADDMTEPTHLDRFTGEAVHLGFLSPMGVVFCYCAEPFDQQMLSTDAFYERYEQLRKEVK